MLDLIRRTSVHSSSLFYFDGLGSQEQITDKKMLKNVNGMVKWNRLLCENNMNCNSNLLFVFCASCVKLDLCDLMVWLLK